MRLRIEIDAEGALPALRDAGEKVERGRRLADAALLVEYRDDGHDGLPVYRTLLRTIVTRISARITMTNIASRMTATRCHWNRLSAASSVMPIPPAPTRPRTADSRTLMSQRNSAIDQNAGLTCGQ